MFGTVRFEHEGSWRGCLVQLTWLLGTVRLEHGGRWC